MNIVISDLDGTLLDMQTYSFEAARPALAALREKNVPLILCTSKTRAEVEMWRERLEVHHPFIVENGGAIYIPAGYFTFPPDRAVKRDGYDVVEFGRPYAELVHCLREAATESRCSVIGFHDMTVAEISRRASLPEDQAELAKRREYDEPFEIQGSSTGKLLSAIGRRGKSWTRGNRFYHCTGANDKGVAVEYVREMYRRAFGTVHTIGVGDGHNDAKFLKTVNAPIVIRSRFAVALKVAEPRCRVTRAPGPEGWNEAILPLVDAADRQRDSACSRMSM
ncbi:MAG TPA: HAD-IIB family hydrolase [Verrucomicrobiae bacterium]|nr:HAD-IIB family hydrolase [Verrucomicrobiae bacterium]